ncbi:hypothetical protein ACLOJK_023868 [Asimina triloba]
MASMEGENQEHTVVVEVESSIERDDEAQAVEQQPQPGPKRKRLARLDSLEQEAFKVSGVATAAKGLIVQAASICSILQLTFQSIGVVYGDIGTSPLYAPLYVFSSTFSDTIPGHIDIIGALSLVIYSLTLFPLIKYVFIVLLANYNGDGPLLTDGCGTRPTVDWLYRDTDFHQSKKDDAPDKANAESSSKLEALAAAHWSLASFIFPDAPCDSERELPLLSFDFPDTDLSLANRASLDEL